MNNIDALLIDAQIYTKFKRKESYTVITVIHNGHARVRSQAASSSQDMGAVRSVVGKDPRCRNESNAWDSATLGNLLGNMRLQCERADA